MTSRFLTLDRDALFASREAFLAGHADIAARVCQVCAEADEALLRGPYTVTAKQVTPDGAGRHDYCSLGTYWWPDETKPNGKPYIRRDGLVNPMGRDDTLYDRCKLDALKNDLRLLSTAWFYTEKAEYAEKGRLLIDTWFISEKTKMNPHLNFAQSIPGICRGRDIGIIDTHQLPDILESAYLLGYDDSDQLRNWVAVFLDWLLESDNGKGERNKGNNHGLWYDVQVLSLARFCGKIIDESAVFARLRRRMDMQIEADGSLPLELERTRSFTYTCFALQALLKAALLDVDGTHGMAEYCTEKSGNISAIKSCLAHLRPYVLGEKEWAWQQITPISGADGSFCFRLAEYIYPGQGYAETVKHSCGLNCPADALRHPPAAALQMDKG